MRTTAASAGAASAVVPWCGPFVEAVVASAPSATFEQLLEMLFQSAAALPGGACV